MERGIGRGRKEGWMDLLGCGNVIVHNRKGMRRRGDEVVWGV